MQLARQLHPYQLEGFRWMAAMALRKKSMLLADEMGLGKTAQAIALLASLSGPHLVVAPLAVLGHWQVSRLRYLPDD